MNRPSQPVIPDMAWTRRFDERPLRPWRPMRLSLKAFFEMLPLIVRVLRFAQNERQHGRRPFMDTVEGIKITPDLGVPLGGLGGGTITRGFRGDFVRWQMAPGLVHYGAVPADQFSLWARRPGTAAQAVVLNPCRRPAKALSAWEWGLPEAKGTYHALFPRAWTTYTEPLPGLKLTCRQVSPVIPHNYTESSFPVGVFVWTLENTGETDVEAALMFTFQNGTGEANDLRGGHVNRAFHDKEAVGVTLQHLHRLPKPLAPGQKLSQRTYFEDPLTFALAARPAGSAQITQRARFSANGDGAELWNDFAADGLLEAAAGEAPSAVGESIGAAVAAKVRLPPGQAVEVAFGLAWDMPVARFGSGAAWYRRYTRFYGREGQAAVRLVSDALAHYPVWEAEIEKWQAPVLADAALPDWYKATLFNETYYLVDGGTLWTAGPAGEAPAGGEALPEPDIGHFAYLESYEYRMYNTYDVHFYASFALAMLWPELEISLQRDYIHALEVEHPEICLMLLSGHTAPRKVRGAMPHDLGSPSADPWRQVNAYIMQDVGRWKDLNPKFVLQVYRDFVLTRDEAFLREAWPAIQRALDYMQRFDRDGDGLIENDGYPDQTYDTWSVQGPSAYTGGLWLAGLSAAAAIAEQVGQPAAAAAYRQQLDRARQAYGARLWNGEYFQYDASRSRHHDSIMADQLAGHWFARACGLPEVVPAAQARSALKKIFAFNVQRFRNGESGALNGMRPDGTLDKTSMQSVEMWTGTTYALAASMLQEGLSAEAFATARGVYLATYRDLGLFFQTPEAVSVDNTYRAMGYMRPLAIWAMQWAWEGRHPAKEKPDVK